MTDLDQAPVDPDPHFASTERLFRRVPVADVVGMSVNDTALPMPSFSVNREKYSIPGDVLRGYAGFRVAAFKVEDIPPELSSESGDGYQFGVEHEPLPENYSHSGVHTYREGMKQEKKPPKLVRKKFRDLLRRKIEILDVATD
jgi:hypothetical protein